MALALETSEERFVRKLLRNADPGKRSAIILVGSAVRQGAMSDTSDIDMLAIGVEIPKFPPPRIQVLPLTEDAFRKRVFDGDDFAQWSLRFGKPIAGRVYWRRIRDELLPVAPWPDHERKRNQARIRLAFAEQLVRIGDDDAAREELRFALSHLARAALLEQGVFPLSRGELASQLRAVSDDHLATAIERLNHADENGDDLAHAIDLAEQRLATTESHE